MSYVLISACTRNVLILKLVSFLSSGPLDRSHTKVQEDSGLSQILSSHTERRMKLKLSKSGRRQNEVSRFQALGRRYHG